MVVPLTAIFAFAPLLSTDERVAATAARCQFLAEELSRYDHYKALTEKIQARSVDVAARVLQMKKTCADASNFGTNWQTGYYALSGLLKDIKWLNQNPIDPSISLGTVMYFNDIEVPVPMFDATRKGPGWGQGPPNVTQCNAFGTYLDSGDEMQLFNQAQTTLMKIVDGSKCEGIKDEDPADGLYYGYPYIVKNQAGYYPCLDTSLATATLSVTWQQLIPTDRDEGLFSMFNRFQCDEVHNLVSMTCFGNSNGGISTDEFGMWNWIVGAERTTEAWVSRYETIMMLMGKKKTDLERRLRQCNVDLVDNEKLKSFTEKAEIAGFAF